MHPAPEKIDERGQMMMMRTSEKTKEVLKTQEVREFTCRSVDLPLAAGALASRQDISVPALA